MKITIELDELEIVKQYQQELTELDNEFRALLDAVNSANDSDTPYVLQFQKLIERAENRAKNKPANYAPRVEAYARSYLLNRLFYALNPVKQQMITRLRTLERSITGNIARHLSEDFMTIERQTEQEGVKFSDIGRDIQKQIDKQIEQALADIVEAEKV